MLFVSGLSVNEIATRLDRRKQTISTQKTTGMAKLGIEKDADLFKFASELGLRAARPDGASHTRLIHHSPDPPDRPRSTG
ncbi:hypothetical protein B0X78_01080 [bacterium AM6]|nr:hypothetical protein B0X78_01080 [bacterium AM6]